ncbi:antitoxin Phd_YefM, type II toxin-antitoxin system [Rhodococcus sp. Br-6]|nr:antitoxin Phd_YefM, type II toxin-antitoxin system [Rhodococcus sp. Br-6]
MITWKSVTASEAQDRLVEMVDEVVGESNVGYEITVDDEVAAVLVGADEYEWLKAIVEVASDPESMRRYVEALDALEEGEVLGVDEVRAMMSASGPDAP